MIFHKSAASRGQATVTRNPYLYHESIHPKGIKHNLTAQAFEGVQATCTKFLESLPECTNVPPWDEIKLLIPHPPDREPEQMPQDCMEEGRGGGGGNEHWGN